MGGDYRLCLADCGRWRRVVAAVDPARLGRRGRWRQRATNRAPHHCPDHRLPALLLLPALPTAALTLPPHAVSLDAGDHHDTPTPPSTFFGPGLLPRRRGRAAFVPPRRGVCASRGSGGGRRRGRWPPQGRWLVGHPPRLPASMDRPAAVTALLPLGRGRPGRDGRVGHGARGGQGSEQPPCRRRRSFGDGVCCCRR